MEDVVLGFFWGFVFGVGTLMLIQSYGKRKVRKALAALTSQSQGQGPGQIPEAQISYDLESRIAVLEQIVTDPRRRLHEEIERLR